MQIEIESDSVMENQDFMRSHRDSYPVHIVRARVEDIIVVNDEYHWARYDIDSKGNLIEGTVKVLRKEVYL